MADLTVRCAALTCTLAATSAVRWEAALVPVCDVHAQGQLAEIPVDAAPAPEPDPEPV